MHRASANPGRLRAPAVRPGLRLLAVGAIALLISSSLVFRASLAAFTASTTNPGNNWTAGTVAISDDDSGTARFSATTMVPGGANASGTACVAVTYTGSVTANVRLFVLAADYTGTGLGQYLTFTIEEGTGGTFADCTGFVAGSTLYGPGTLSGFAGASSTYATGVSAWQPTTGQSKTYRLTYALQDNNGAQGLTANAVFTWEAHSL